MRNRHKLPQHLYRSQRYTLCGAARGHKSIVKLLPAAGEVDVNAEYGDGQARKIVENHEHELKLSPEQEKGPPRIAAKSEKYHSVDELTTSH
jgi:hypothetical protein